MIRQRVLAGVVLVSTFSLGAVTGIFIDRHVAISVSHDELSPNEIHEAATAQMQEVLQLDDEQLAKVHAILADRQELVQRAWEEMRPQVQEAMREVHIEIADLLTPEQRERYHAWLAEQRRQLEDEGDVFIIPH